jgi:hypothetical protein
MEPTTYKPVNLHELQKAFALAHRASILPAIPLKQRKIFRAIGAQIWKSCGEDNPYPKDGRMSDPDLEAILYALAEVCKKEQSC